MVLDQFVGSYKLPIACKFGERFNKSLTLITVVEEHSIKTVAVVRTWGGKDILDTSTQYDNPQAALEEYERINVCLSSDTAGQ